MKVVYVLSFLTLALAPPAWCVGPHQDHHEHHAPHQGTLVELGDEAAHVELVLDAKLGLLTAYVLDGEAEGAVRIAQRTIPIRILSTTSSGTRSIQRQDLTLSAVANPLTGETEGDTSQFRARSKYLEGVTEFDAVLPSLSIKGAPFSNVSVRVTRGPGPIAK